MQLSLLGGGKGPRRAARRVTFERGGEVTDNAERLLLEEGFELFWIRR